MASRGLRRGCRLTCWCNCIGALHGAIVEAPEFVSGPADARISRSRAGGAASRRPKDTAMSQRKPAQPAHNLDDPKQPAVRIHIGGLYVEIDHVPGLPRWLITIASSIAAAGLAAVWHWH